MDPYGAVKSPGGKIIVENIKTFQKMLEKFFECLYLYTHIAFSPLPTYACG